MDAGSLPIVEAIVDNGEMEIPDFKIGNEDSWFVEWRGMYVYFTLSSI